MANASKRIKINSQGCSFRVRSEAERSANPAVGLGGRVCAEGSAHMSLRRDGDAGRAWLRRRAGGTSRLVWRRGFVRRCADRPRQLWIEEGTGSFQGRASSIDTSDGAAGGGEVTFAVASSPSGVLGAVSQWLGDFTRPATIPIDTD